MANRITGNYDAVLQLSTRGADRILASVHGKGAPHPNRRLHPDGEPGPRMIHSGALNFPLFQGRSVESLPGMRPLPEGAIVSRLKGHLQFQVSTPSITVPSDSDGSRVTVSTEIYAWYQEARGSEAAPEFSHGKLSLTTGIVLVRCGEETLVEVDLRSDDVEVAFAAAPGSGMTPADEARVQAIASEIVRHTFEPVQLRVSGIGSDEFAVRELAFRALRQGSRQALAVLTKLSGETRGATNPADVTEVFLVPDEDLALFAGREFLTERMQAEARDELTEVRASGSRFGLSFSASADPDSLQLEFEQGRLRFRIEGSGSTTLGSFRFRLTQRVGFRTGATSLVLDGDPDLDVTDGNIFLRGVFGLFRGRIESSLKEGMGEVRVQATRELRRVAEESVNDLLERASLPDVSFRLRRGDITPDGVALGGDFRLEAAPAVVASFTNQIKRPSQPRIPQLSLFVELDALQSWIPGGTIQEYRWSEVRGDGTISRRVTERHSFLLRVLRDELVATSETGGIAPTAGGNEASGAGSGGEIGAGSASTGIAGLTVTTPSPGSLVATGLGPSIGWPPYQWCLEVHGTQVVTTRDTPAPVSGKVCGMSVAVPSVDLQRDALLTVRVPDGRGGVLADLDPWGRILPHSFADDEECRGFLLVHFAGRQEFERSSSSLCKTLLASSLQHPVLPTLIVEEDGDGRRLPCPELARLAYTHDPTSAWRRRFRIEKPETTLLIGPGGKELWRSEGGLAAEELQKVLEAECKGEDRIPRTRQVDLEIFPGVLAPDFLFPCDSGSQIATALRKMAGREALVAFWTSWSEPSLEELRRLGTRFGGGGKQTPMVVLVNDGEDPDLARETLDRLDLGFHAVSDPDREIARRYGVSCWPTVVRVGPGGGVAEVRLGLEPELGPEAEPCDEPLHYASST